MTPFQILVIRYLNLITQYLVVIYNQNKVNNLGVSGEVEDILRAELSDLTISSVKLNGTCKPDVILER